MIIHKYCAESTEDGSIFNAKLEIETDLREEFEAVLKVLPVIKTVDKCETVCHCNVKENAGLIARILDYDACGEVAPYTIHSLI